MVLWNTIYMHAALEKLREDGLDVQRADVARLSAREYRHINLLGSYSFALDDDITSGHLRPLRTPEKIQEFIA